MYLYNVTIKVSAEIHDIWLHWLQEEHIPDVMQTGCFSGFSIYRLLEVDDSEGPTYAVQYRAESKSLYNHYIDKYANELRRKTYEKWGDSFIAFRTLMQAVN